MAMTWGEYYTSWYTCATIKWYGVLYTCYGNKKSVIPPVRAGHLSSTIIKLVRKIIKGGHVMSTERRMSYEAGPGSCV